MGNKYENEILRAFEGDKLPKSQQFREDLDKSTTAAANYFSKSERINIRLSKVDLDRVKRVAASEGIPYQTMISSILHKYVMQYAEPKKVLK